MASSAGTPDLPILDTQILTTPFHSYRKMKAARKLDMAKGHGATCASDLEPLKFDASRRDKKRLKSPRDKSDSTYRGWERRRTRGGERRRTPGFVTPGKSCVHGGREREEKRCEENRRDQQKRKKKKKMPQT